jgi:hypothetical protein
MRTRAVADFLLVGDVLADDQRVLVIAFLGSTMASIFM